MISNLSSEHGNLAQVVIIMSSDTSTAWTTELLTSNLDYLLDWKQFCLLNRQKGTMQHLCCANELQSFHSSESFSEKVMYWQIKGSHQQSPLHTLQQATFTPLCLSCHGNLSSYNQRSSIVMAAIFVLDAILFWDVGWVLGKVLSGAAAGGCNAVSWLIVLSHKYGTCRWPLKHPSTPSRVLHVALDRSWTQQIHGLNRRNWGQPELGRGWICNNRMVYYPKVCY